MLHGRHTLAHSYLLLLFEIQQDDNSDYPIAQAAMDMVRGMGHILAYPMGEKDDKGFLQLDVEPGNEQVEKAYRAFDRMNEFCKKIVDKRLTCTQIEDKGLETVAEKNLDFLSSALREAHAVYVARHECTTLIFPKDNMIMTF